METFRQAITQGSESEIRQVLSQLTPENRQKVRDAVQDQSGGKAQLIDFRIVDLSGTELQKLTMAPADLISQVIACLSLVDNVQGRLVFDEQILENERSLEECGVRPGATLTLMVIEKPPTAPKMDYYDSDEDVRSRMSTPITDFGYYNDSAGIGLLKGHQISAQEIRSVVHTLQGAFNGKYASYPDAALLSRDLCQLFMSLADDKSDKMDFTVRLTQMDLVATIGLTAVSSIFAFFGDRVDWITLRRVEAKGQCIKLHLDEPLKTMQIPLNDEAEYEGGKLLYITSEGLEFPRRNAGSATVHDNTIVHGVTPMMNGVRYSLFLSKIDDLPGSGYPAWSV